MDVIYLFYYLEMYIEIRYVFPVEKCIMYFEKYGRR